MNHAKLIQVLPRWRRAHAWYVQRGKPYGTTVMASAIESAERKLEVMNAQALGRHLNQR
jgi:hypothetical protein